MNEQELALFLDQKLVEIASVLMAHYDCCALRGAACRGGDPNPCCTNTTYGVGMCPFWMGEACQFQNCACKLWICRTAIEATDPKCVEGLELLEQFAGLFGLTRKPFIGHPYSGADKPKRHT